MTNVIDLHRLHDDARAWLREQPTDRALYPDEIDRYRARFYLQWWIVAAIERERTRAIPAREQRRGEGRTRRK
jgi:hypothetical protein